MDNVASFVTEAAARGIYTMPSVDGFPVNSYYWEITTEPLASLDKFFHMTEHRGAINGQFAPIVRPDPCR